ncbi:hypothetical protein M378DRAFT_1039420 [Amanita muscaria Koide BX008]|uniref:Uncharacterized protein n=1 Tax=Amanita muscaria (strain Koide BX008) TaxID=946122 RepID=A0A0C2SPD4_AMAMK|nr:hypothetical protein M378DRAFT_1039420 [Amanita muscaria Koide BX008]
MIAVCPTKALQENMGYLVCKNEGVWLFISSDTYAKARKAGKDLWVDAQTCLRSFLNRFLWPCIHAWSRRDTRIGREKSFRPAFRQIGNLRAHLPKIQGVRGIGYQL